MDILPKTVFFFVFFCKGGGGLAQSKISLTEKFRASKLMGGHPVYFWPKLTSRLVEGSHQVAIFQIVLVVAIKRSQGDPGSAKSMQTDILTH